MSSKKADGLGVGCLKSKNIGLLAKWRWRFYNEKNALWNKVINELYGPEGGFDSNTGGGGCLGVWNNIICNSNDIDKLQIPFNSPFVKKVASGNQTRFWFDIWCKSGQNLKEKFPRLYALETNKKCFISDRWVNKDGIWTGNWEWIREPRGRT